LPSVSNLRTEALNFQPKANKDSNGQDDGMTAFDPKRTFPAAAVAALWTYEASRAQNNKRQKNSQQKWIQHLRRQ